MYVFPLYMFPFVLIAKFVMQLMIESVSKPRPTPSTKEQDTVPASEHY